jgi:hypothetical protein
MLASATSGSCLADEQAMGNSVETGGLKALMPVSSHGSLTAFLRKVQLSSGEKWAVDLYGDHLVGFQMDNQAIAPDQPDNSAVSLSIRDANSILASAVNLDNVTVATGSHIEGGAMVLDPAQGLGQQTLSPAARVHPKLATMLKNFKLRQFREQQRQASSKAPGKTAMPDTRHPKS